MQNYYKISYCKNPQFRHVYICTGTATIIHLSSVIFWDELAHKMGYYCTSTTLFQREKGTTQTIIEVMVRSYFTK